MTSPNALRVHRAMMATPEDRDVCWWYLGATLARPDGHPQMLALEAETIMIYRTETLSADSYRIRWLEIGYFRDPVSGETATEWINPVTGKTVAAPGSFEEGPSAYTVRIRDDGTLSVELVQAHATVRGITAELAEHDGRLRLTQTERKVRGFPLPDGSMPGADSGALAETTTVLSLFADRDAVLGAAAPPGASVGLYSFELPLLPPWMGFAGTGRTLVSGVMRKTGLDSRLNAVARSRLQGLFPSYFTGDDLTPPWD